MRPPLSSFLFIVAFTVQLASADSFETKVNTAQPCVRVRVRAEDLSPNHISRGDLRIEVTRQECAQQIASVTLRLQLDEFGEVKYLKEGAVLPEVHPSNESWSTEYSSSMGSDVVYDYQAHDDGLSDPELWTIKAEERRAWTTEAILLTDPDLSQPVITPFTVAVPAVNYPPVISKFRFLKPPVGQGSFTDLSYRYIAIVTFTDGCIESVAVGHTAFIPSESSSQMQVQSPFTWNLTFEDPKCIGCDHPREKKRQETLKKCLPKAQRSVFSAEVTLDNGKVAAPGQSLTGRVTVHKIKNGATTLSDISVRLQSTSREQWPQLQSGASAESACSDPWIGLCCTSPVVSDQLQAESNSWNFAKSGNDRYIHNLDDKGLAKGAITLSNSQFSFELQVPHRTPVDFVSYYSQIENQLAVELEVLYPLEVARCIHSGQKLDSLEKEDDPATIEEGLWNIFGPVEPQSVSHRRTTLNAKVPFIIVSTETSDQSIAHYLSPDGAVAPVLRSGLQMDMPASFLPIKPLIIVEDIATTSARLMRPGSTNPLQTRQRVMNITSLLNYPDPTKAYRGGNYVGVLWKKKIVAEERGIWPLRNEAVVDEGNDQRPLIVVP
ncbi:hypothetical protein R3P38DRAFT_3210965 [Favolaschia claudopus]|uniref:Uncharacterized protein n=1 Tax=Favolaschia claudopus TaxID=2862362 RepID=A0AAW0AHP5_9AGAR